MTFRKAALAAVAPLLLLADLPSGGSSALTLGREAAAVVGAPLTPVSAAGVARRTTRRVVAVESTAASSAAAASASQQQATVAQQQAAAAPPPAIGTVVPALPAGCVSEPKGDVQYFRCGNAYYRPAFQGNNRVYAVVAKP